MAILPDLSLVLMHRLLQYLKIFLGMGVTWIFEVLALALGERTPEEAWQEPLIKCFM